MAALDMKKWSESVSRSVVSNSLQPQGWNLPAPSVHWILQVRILEWVAISYFKGFYKPWIESRVSIKELQAELQADSLRSEVPGKFWI